MIPTGENRRFASAPHAPHSRTWGTGVETKVSAVVPQASQR